MDTTTSIAALFLLLAPMAPPHPVLPPDAVPEAVQEHPLPEPAPAWFAKALEAWGRPRPPLPNLYDHRYITW